MASTNIFNKWNFSEHSQSKNNNNRHLTAFLPVTYHGEPLLTPIENAASALLAIHHFNNRISDVVQFPEFDKSSEREWCGDLKFTFEIIDSQLSAKATLQGFSDVIAWRQQQRQQPKEDEKNHYHYQTTTAEEKPFPTALIGAARSQVSSPLARLSGVYGIPQISHSSTSSVFENTDQYPLFGRLIPSVSGDAEAAISYFSDVLGVTHLFVLFLKDEYGLSYAQAMKSAGLSRGMTIDSASFPFHADEQGISDVVVQLERSGYHYFYGIFFQEQLIPVMTEARRRGVAGPGYFWTFSDGVYGMSAVTLRSKSDSSLIEALSGTAQITLAHPSSLLRRRERVTSFVQALNGTFGRGSSPGGRKYFESNMPKELNAINNGTYLKNYEFTGDIHPFSLTAYESVMALAFAACDAQSNVGVDFNGFDLYDSFLRTEFDGVYGKISFNPKTGTRVSQTVPYSLSNIIARPTNNNNTDDGDNDVTFELKTTHLYGQKIEDEGTNSSIVAEWKKVPGQEFVYCGGGVVPPNVLPPLVEEKNFIMKSVLVFGLTLCGVTLILSLWFGSWTAYRKDSKVIKASQPIFLEMLCLGTFIMGCSIIPMSLQEPLSQGTLDFACTSMVWFLSIGFVVAFSALISKTMRINKIFFAKGYKRVTVKPQHVLWPFLVLFTANTTVLILWTLISPIKYHRVMKSSLDKFGRQTESFGTCYLADTDKFDTTFLALLIGINLLSLLYANYQAYLGRNIELQYSESRYIGLSMTLILQVSLVGIPTLILVHDSPTASFLVRSSLVTIICVAILLPIIIPKMIFFAQWQIEEVEKEESRDLRRRRMKSFRDRICALSQFSHRKNCDKRENANRPQEEEETGLAILQSKDMSRCSMLTELNSLNQENIVLEQQRNRNYQMLSIMNQSISETTY